MLSAFVRRTTLLQGLTSNKITGAKKKKTGRKDAKQCEQIKEGGGGGKHVQKVQEVVKVRLKIFGTTSVGQAGTTLGKEDHTGTNF